MSKRAEQAANIAFDDEWPKSLRLAFQEGYEQAEKELALTWKNIRDIDEWISAIQTSDGLFGRDLYEEVLKRFNESRRDKNEKD